MLACKVVKMSEDKSTDLPVPMCKRCAPPPPYSAQTLSTPAPPPPYTATPQPPPNTADEPPAQRPPTPAIPLKDPVSLTAGMKEWTPVYASKRQQRRAMAARAVPPLGRSLLEKFFPPKKKNMSLKIPSIDVRKKGLLM